MRPYKTPGFIVSCTAIIIITIFFLSPEGTRLIPITSLKQLAFYRPINVYYFYTSFRVHRRSLCTRAAVTRTIAKTYDYYYYSIIVFMSRSFMRLFFFFRTFVKQVKSTGIIPYIIIYAARPHGNLLRVLTVKSDRSRETLPSCYDNIISYLYVHRCINAQTNNY